MSRDVKIRNQLAERYMPLVHALAKKIAYKRGKAADLGELVSNGSLGLLDAIGKFSPDRGVLFSTYASRRIWGAIFDGVRDVDWLSRSERRKKPDARLRHFSQITSADDDQNIYAFQDRSAREPIEEIAAEDWRKKILRRLPRTERFLLTLYFFANMTMREAAEAAGFTESRASQLIAGALRILRAQVSSGEIASEDLS